MNEILTRLRQAAQELLAALDAAGAEELAEEEHDAGDTLTPVVNRELERMLRGGRYTV